MSYSAPKTAGAGFVPNKETAKRRELQSAILADFITKAQAKRHDPKAKGSAKDSDRRYAATELTEGGPNKGSPVGGPSARPVKKPARVRPRKQGHAKAAEKTGEC